ncbi:hypothetical protein BDV98DRAFT_596845 [Pterulicium gracile]|uniref:DUF4874 domain-containing protein n=1 Tax=Pterulicium gracile TaxID=1884261 RepID=A0A5C3Q7U5_9AGAR|nr:hypothetical protein BDV98DRAFT_596845 [Pterula gracilis]
MRFFTALVPALLASVVSAGFTTYKLIAEGANNANQLTYYAPQRSTSLFLYIQILPDGGAHQSIINDFRTLVRNYGSKGVSIVPRIRYGPADGSEAPEPDNAALIRKDVELWAGVFKSVEGQIQIPVIHAGFLGLWGEWHGGPFCGSRGERDNETNKTLKRFIVDTLRSVTGKKVALRYPEDHHQLYRDSRAVTIHNDCILSAGPGTDGGDGGTFPSTNREWWKEYTIKVAGGNTYGGEGCDMGWGWNFGDVCGSNGLVAYVNRYKMSYINPGNPMRMQQLFNSADYKWCVDAIEAAMNKYQ